MRLATLLRCCLLSLLAASATGCVTHRVLEHSETVHEKLGEKTVGIDCPGYNLVGQTATWPMQLRITEQHRDTTTYTLSVEYQYDSYLSNLDVADEPIIALLAFPTSLVFDLVGFAFSAPFEYLAGAAEDLHKAPSVREYERTRTEPLPDETAMVLHFNGERADDTEYRGGQVAVQLGDPALVALARGETQLKVEIGLVYDGTMLGVRATFELEEMLAFGEMLMPTPLAERVAAWQEVRDRVPDDAISIRRAIDRRLQPLQQQLAVIASAKQRADRIYELDDQLAVLRTTADATPDQRRKTIEQLVERADLHAAGFWLQGKIQQHPEGARDDLDDAMRIASNLDDLDLLEAVLARALALNGNGGGR